MSSSLTFEEALAQEVVHFGGEFKNKAKIPGKDIGSF